jgi:hypothetical protein
MPATPHRFEADKPGARIEKNSGAQWRACEDEIKREVIFVAGKPFPKIPVKVTPPKALPKHQPAAPRVTRTGVTKPKS